MNWVRKGFVGLLSLFLLVSLLGTALSVSTNIALSHPDKIESWLSQSNFYDHFVTNAIDQAKKSAGSSEDQGSVTLSDSAIQQAAQSAFSSQILQQSVKTFLDSNYAWLEGKTAQPNFVIDLTKPKQKFADQVGQYVQAHFASLPVCTAQQLAALGDVQNIDPLNITCRPAGLSAQAEAAIVTQKINTSSNFLSNPVITANNINPNGGSQAKPYYQKFSKAPELYQAGVKLPWIYAVVAVLCSLGVVFISSKRRKGLRRVGVILTEVGILLVVIKFVDDIALKQAEKRIFNGADVGQLQQSLTVFLHRAESQLTKIDLWFGIAYLILALVIFAALFGTRGHKSNKSKHTPSDIDDSPSTNNDANTTEDISDVPPTPARPTPTGPPTMPPKPKRSRLVQ